MNKEKGLHHPFLKKKKKKSGSGIGGNNMVFQFWGISDCFTLIDYTYIPWHKDR